MKLSILGRPGSGKSTVARLVGLPCFSDYPILSWMAHREHARFAWPLPDCFEVQDARAYDDALTLLDGLMQSFDGPCCATFSRRDYDAALSVLPEASRRASHFLFLDAPLALCAARIAARAGHHGLPPGKLTSYYRVQVPPTCVPCHTIINTGSMTDLEAAVSAWLAHLS